MLKLNKKWKCNYCNKTFTDITEMYDTGSKYTKPLCLGCVDKKPMPTTT